MGWDIQRSTMGRTEMDMKWDRNRDTETGSGYLIVATVDHLHIGK